MTDVKTALTHLCDILKTLYNFHLEPILFKMAKHDKIDDDVVPTFWNLLNTFHRKLTTDNLTYNVKIFFASQNYRNIEFYSLPEDMSYGSRELLIAFGWILSKNNILEGPLKRKILESQISQEFNPTEEFYANSELNLEFKKILEYQNYILALCGKINTNLKAIAEYNSQMIPLLNKVHNVTNDLSVGEIYHLKSSGDFNDYIRKIKHITELTDTYMKWKMCEKHFWKWMITVIEMKNGNNEFKWDKTNLISFFKLLKTHMKHILQEAKDTEDITVLETNFARCVQSKNSESFDKKLKSIDDKLVVLKTEEQNNMRQICKYLHDLL